MKENWTPQSWKNKEALHQPSYEDISKLKKVTNRMKKLPPLVFAGEVRELKVCKGGRVKGSLSYSSIVVEVGATISGPMKPIEKDPVLLIENK